MTTFITGGTSSIGRVLIRQLSRQDEHVRVLARSSSNRKSLDLPGVEFITGDVTDPKSVIKGMEGCERVCHLAAIVGHNLPEAEWWRVNRDGSRNVLQAAFHLGVRSMVQVSSIGVLGNTAPGETADETRPVDTGKYINLYQKTKRAADDLARSFAEKGLNVMIVYPGFGFGHSWASSHPSLHEMTLLRMAAGKPVAIMGSGKNKLCVAYYKDTAQAILLALKEGKQGDDYILLNENLTFPEIWAVIADLLGKQPPRAHIPLPILKIAAMLAKVVPGKATFPSDFFDMISLNWCFSSAKAKRELGWQPLSFRAAIAETWSDYRTNP